MRKLIVWNLITLDGKFDGRKPWDLDWHEYGWGEELEKFGLDQSMEVGVLLFGRATYEGMAKYWPEAQGATADFMNTVPKIVFSRTLDDATWNNTLVRKDAAQEVRRLKKEEGRSLFIFGSATLCASLEKEGLIDEYRLCLCPVVLGEGRPMFPAMPAEQRMHLLEARRMQSGSVILFYEPVRE